MIRASALGAEGRTFKSCIPDSNLERCKMRISGTTFSDNHDPIGDLKKKVGPDLCEFLIRVNSITKADLAKNHSEDLLFVNTVEELGEYAAAKTVEKGIKKKKLKESSTVEAVDLIICSLSLFFANNGTMEDLCKIGQEKLNKWEERVK